MKKLGFIVCYFIVLTSSAFGQQLLWSTAKEDSTAKHVSLSSVPKEVLNLYDQYELYYDFSGFSKDRFIEKFDDGFDSWTWISDVKDLTVYAIRSNTGQGSFVAIVCVSQDNFDMIVFSNTIQPELGTGVMRTDEYKRERFEKWFNTLLNYDNDTAEEQPRDVNLSSLFPDKGTDLGVSSSGATLEGRSLDGALPLPNYNVQQSGKVIVRIKVDRDGNVVEAKADQRGSTVMDATLYEAAEHAARRAKFNSSPNSPIYQNGVITYVFRLGQ